MNDVATAVSIQLMLSICFVDEYWCKYIGIDNSIVWWMCETDRMFA